MSADAGAFAFDGFEWDIGNADKCRRHGVPQGEIEDLFSSGPAIIRDDPHSGAELRYRAVGRTAQGRPIFIVFTLRRRGGLTLVRPISARYMHKKEIESYGQASPAGSSE